MRGLYVALYTCMGMIQHKSDVNVCMGTVNYQLVHFAPSTIAEESVNVSVHVRPCLLYTSPSPRDATLSRMPSSA